MKKLIINTKVPILLLIIICVGSSNAQVGFGTNSPNPAALLDITSTSKGFLPPRVTFTQRNAIASPANGLIIWCADCGSTGEMQVFNGSTWTNMAGGAASPLFVCGTSTVSFIYNGSAVTYGTVSNAGKCWLDRNLGATRVATVGNDAAASGDLFQWGRGDDGHQIRTSGTTNTLSNTDEPGHGNFITRGNTSPYDWRTPQNNNLWQGVRGKNNPCPNGFRLPNNAEINAEMASWGAQNQNNGGAFASPLKLPLTGTRTNAGSIASVNYGIYWTSDRINIACSYLGFGGSGASINEGGARVYGSAVRCIKD